MHIPELPTPEILRSASHWGAFRVQVQDQRLVGVQPFEHDPHPGRMIHVWPEMQHSPLRIPRPLVRRGWLAGDGGAARGRDTFIPVEWDVALDHVAGELDRVRSTYGNSAIFGGSYGWSSAGRLHHARTLLHRFLNTLGGFTGQATNYSYGAVMAFLPRILGSVEAVAGPVTTWHSIGEHCDLLLAFGGLATKNWEIHSGGGGQHRLQDWLALLQKRPVSVLNISPQRDDVAASVGARWLPLRPNTDTALILALSYCLVRDGLEDKAFLARHCTDFGPLRRYLLGEADGQAKSPAWAAQITGIEAGEIEALARQLVGKRVLLTAAWSLQRARHGEQSYWALVALACILGQVGLPGGGFAFGYGSMGAMGNPLYDSPIGGLPVGPNPVGISIPVARVADLLLQPGEEADFNGQRLVYPDTRLVYWAGGNPFHHHQDLNRLRQAFRRPETVVVHDNFWTATARHADIVLPVTTTLERNDIGGSSRDPFLLAMHQALPAEGQARDDYEIFASLAGRLGRRDAFTEGRSANAWLPELWAGMRQALAARGLDAPDFDTFWRKGYYELPEAGRDFFLFERFRTDPDKHPLKTPSGRIELFCEEVARFGYAGQTGHPLWLDPEEWLGAPLARTYPLHLLTPQPETRLHGQMDGSGLSQGGKRDGREILRLHPADAAARGLVEGDIVRVFNLRGACLASLALSDGVTRGVAVLPTGATFDPDDTGQVDGMLEKHGNPNVLTRDVGTSELGQGCAAHSCLVEVERFQGPVPAVTAFDPPWLAHAMS